MTKRGLRGTAAQHANALTGYIRAIRKAKNCRERFELIGAARAHYSGSSAARKAQLRPALMAAIEGAYAACEARAK